ncbi:MAG TPA: hypothetical protein PK095_03725 [Myxococcota bacterium]|nr:hypothetical protein [Myxococcota bacterium]
MRARALLWSSLVLLACAGEEGPDRSTDAADTSGADLDDGSADTADAPVTVGVCPWMTFTVTSAIDGHRARQYLPYTVLAPYVNAPDGLPEHFRWSVTTPDGSLASIDAQAQRPLFMPTLPGPYTLRLERFDAAGVACETLAHEFGVMTASVHVVMTWRTPNRENQIPINLGAMKPDLDLHLLHSGGGAFFDPRWDCFFENSSPDWGAPGPADDPELFEPYMMDDALEVIAVAPRSSPSSDQNHRVGVHLWNDAGYGESLATVRVYVDGVLRDTWADVALRQGDLWESHIIDWPSGTVTRITNTDGTAFITPMYPVSP